MHIYLAFPQNETRAKRARSGFLSGVKRPRYPAALSRESRPEARFFLFVSLFRFSFPSTVIPVHLH